MGDFVTDRFPAKSKALLYFSAAVSVLWFAGANILKSVPSAYLQSVASTLEPLRNGLIERFVEIRIAQGGNELLYAIYGYGVLPVYVICFLSVTNAVRLSRIGTPVYPDGGLNKLYKRRMGASFVMFAMMIVSSLYLTNYFASRNEATYITTLALSDIIVTWCQGIFAGVFFSSLKDIKHGSDDRPDGSDR